MTGRFDRIGLLAGCALLSLAPLAHMRALRWFFLLVLLLFGVHYCLRLGTIRLPPVAGYWLGFALLAAASSLWSRNPAHSLHSLWRDLLLPGIATLSIYLLARHGRWRLYLLVASAVPLVICTALAVAIALTLPGGIVEWFDLQEMRMLGHWMRFFPGPGEASTLAVYAIPLMALLWATTTQRLWAGLLLIGCFLLGILTENRMFWPAACASLVTFIALVRTWSRQGLFALVGVTLLIAISTTLLANTYRLNLRPIVGEVVDGYNQSRLADTRPAMWRFWVNEGIKHPWLGKGYGRYTPTSDLLARDIPYPTPPNRRQPEQAYEHAHNAVLNLWLQLGLVGLITATLCLVSLGRTLSAQLAQPSTRPYAAAGFALIVAALCKNATDDFMVDAPVTFLAAALGICLAGASAVASRAIFPTSDTA